MDLKIYIDANDNYIDVLKQDDFIVKRKRNCILVKYKYEKKEFKNIWEKYCKGCVINIDLKKIVCLSPIKSELYSDTNKYDDDYIVQELIDGTMVNMFYDGCWRISTRSDMDGKNRWNNHTIESLFKQCCDYEHLSNQLNNKHCYCFSMNHKSIRHISNVIENKITLVDEYDMELLTPVKKFTDIEGCDIIKNIDTNDKNMNDIINHYLELNKDNVDFKGLTFKFKNKRVNVLNPKYVEIKNKLNINTDNILYKFIQTKKNRNLNEYIKLYPEHKTPFTKYSDIFNTLCQNVCNSYHDVFIHKVIVMKDVKYQLKPLLYDIQGIYLQNKVYVNIDVVTNYINNLDTKKLVFVMKYYL